MREIIKKVLREAIRINHNTPNWWERIENYPREKRIEFFKNYQKHIQQILPIIVEYFKNKFEDMSVKIEITSRRYGFANDNLKYDKIIINFYFDTDSIISHADSIYDVKKEVYEDLKSIFDIDIRLHGFYIAQPLDIEVYLLETPLP